MFRIHHSRKEAAFLKIYSFLGIFCRCLHIFRNLPHAFSPPSATSFASVVLNLPQICTCEASEYTFRAEAGEGCVFFACAAACPLPCFSPFSSFPLFGRAISVFSERFFNHLHPKKLNDIFVCKLDVLFWYSHNQVWFFECNLVCDFLGWNITVFHIVWYPPDFKIKTWYTEVLI